jgi:hypothetical protein
MLRAIRGFSLHVFGIKSCTHFSCISCVLHAPPFSPSLCYLQYCYQRHCLPTLLQQLRLLQFSNITCQAVAMLAYQDDVCVWMRSFSAAVRTRAAHGTWHTAHVAHSRLVNRRISPPPRRFTTMLTRARHLSLSMNQLISVHTVRWCPGYGQDDLVSMPGRSWNVFSQPPHPDRLWGPPSHLFNGYRWFPAGKAVEASSWLLTSI